MFLKEYLVTRFLQEERMFSEEEEQKLQSALSLDKPALCLVFHSRTGRWASMSASTVAGIKNL